MDRPLLLERPAVMDEIVRLSFDSEVLALRAERGGRVVALDVAGDREALLADVRAGTFTGKLHADARTYIQIDGKPNRNFIRFKATKLDKIARSGRGSVFLRDHAQRDLVARGGTVTASELVTHKTGHAFRQTFELAKLWAIEGFLDGTIDRFSIGWFPIGPILCTACKQDWLKCTHWPGDVVEIEDKAFIVEFEFSDADLVETSGVNVPAVVGTGVEGIRAALEAQRTRLTSGAPPRRTSMRQKLLNLATILGLAALSDDDDRAIVELETAAKGVTQKNRQLEADLSVERESSTRASAALKVAQDRVTALEASTLETELEALVQAGIREGRLALSHDEKGARIPDEIEKALRTIAKEFGIAASRDRLSRLPAIAGVRPPAARADRADPTPRDVAGVALTRKEQKLAAKLNLKPESMLAAKRELAAQGQITSLDEGDNDDENEED